jgi:two-component system sensor kinase FixL
MKRRRSILTYFLIVLAFLIPVGLATFYSYRETKFHLTDLALSRREAVVRLAAGIVGERLERILDLGRSLSTRMAFRDLVTQGKWDEAILMMERVPVDFPTIGRVFLADLSGTLMTDTPPLPGVRGENFAYRDWYRGVSQNWQPYISEAYVRLAEPRHKVIAGAFPVLSAEERPAGILVLQTRLDQVFEWVREVPMTGASVLFITDRRGKVVIYAGLPPQGEIMDFSETPGVALALRGKQGVHLFPGANDQERTLVAYAPVPRHGWTVVLTEPAVSAFYEREKALRDLVFIYGAFFLMSSVLTAAVIWSFTRLGMTSEALRRNEERVRSILETARDAFVSIDAEEKIVEWNAQAQATFGWSRTEVLGRCMKDLIIPARYREAHERGLKHFLKTTEGPILNRRIQIEALHRLGHEFPVELTAWPVRGAGDSWNFHAFIHDITERLKAERELRESEERFHTLARVSPVGIFRTDPKGQCIYVNERWSDITGLTMEEARGPGWAQGLHAEDRVRIVHGWSQAVEREMPFREEYRFERPDGKITWVWGQAVAERGKDGEILGYVGTVTDITEYKEAKEKLILQASELARSKVELEQLELFAHLATHDLQEPLHKIVAFGELLKTSCWNTLDEKGRTHLDKIEKAAKKMGEMIEQLREFSRIGHVAAPLEPVDLHRVVREAMQDSEAGIKETGAEIEVATLPTVDADRMQIRQVFQNLLANALKFRRADEPPRVAIWSRPLDEDWVEITVEDNGIGFDERYADRIFRPFQRLHPAGQYEGSGVGLAICQKILLRHGGKIAARSEMGKGSRFILTLRTSRKGGPS